MARSAGSWLLGLLAVLAAAGANARTCPPPQLDSMKGLDLAKFALSHPWYSQEQVVVSYQPLNSFYCVRARYVPEDPKNLAKGFNVYNFANVGGSNMNPTGVSGAGGNNSVSLFAVPVPGSGPTASSKLLVGPKALLTRAPPAAAVQALKAPNGNYRVLAAEFSKDKDLGYEWAIILGGATAPSQPTDKGCAPSQAKDEGLWLFHRWPIAPVADINKMKAMLTSLGIDGSRLTPVNQLGCTYAGADPPGVAKSG